MTTYESRLMKCKKYRLVMGRDVVAVLNLQMWGSGVTPPESSIKAFKLNDGETAERQTHIYL